MMGSGGLIVMDEDTCMVDIAKFFLEFTVDESCGKCTPCRIGTKRLLEMLDKITKGNGTMEDLDKLEELCHYIKANSLCAAWARPRPTRCSPPCSYFRDEYVAHIVDKKLPGRRMQGAARTMTSIADKCKGCTAVRTQLPGRRDQRHREAAARHRPEQVHQVRRLHGEMQVRRDRARNKEGVY